MVSPTLSKEQSGKVSGSGARYEFEAGGGRYYTLLLATACPDKASEVGQATRLRLVGRPLQKLERHKVAILVEENKAITRTGKSRRSATTARRREEGTEGIGRWGEGRGSGNRTWGTHTTRAKVQRLRKKGREGRGGLNKFQMRRKSPAEKRQRGGGAWLAKP